MTQRAKVTWLPSEEGGRSALPTGTRYVTIGRFPEDGPKWPDGSWSVVLDFPKPPSEQGVTSFGRASFLVGNAPEERLRPGRTFELYEGLRKVATVELLGDS
jgi:hypothetical protein